MSVAMAYGAAHKRRQPAARRIALLIDEQGKIAKIYDPAGTGEFPALVLADIKKDEVRARRANIDHDVDPLARLPPAPAPPNKNTFVSRSRSSRPQAGEWRQVCISVCCPTA